MNNSSKTSKRIKQTCWGFFGDTEIPQINPSKDQVSPEILDNDEPENNGTDWVSFPVDMLPAPLTDFVRSSGKSIGCDEALIVCPLLAGLAAAIGNCRAVRLKDDGDSWVEPSILWTAAVAGSGSKKTPALNLTKSRFREYEKKKRHADLMQSQENEMASKNVDPVPGAMPEQQEDSSIIVCDTTVEGLASRLQGTPKGIFLLRDELSGWIKNLGKYSKNDVPFFLETYQGESHSILRKTTGTSTIPRCSVSITGTIQPDVLRNFLLGSEARINGFIPRFSLAMPPWNKTYWNSQNPGAGAVEDVQKVFDYLLSLPFHPGGDEPEIMFLSGEAQRLFIKEHDRIEDEKENEKSDFLRSFLSKHCAKAARLALIFQCVKEAAGHATCPRLVVDDESMKLAIGVARWFYRETIRCMTILGCVIEGGVAESEKQVVLSIIYQDGPITKRNIQRRRPTLTNLDGTLNTLLSEGRIIQRQHKPESKGRPSIVFETSPSVDTNVKIDTIAPPFDADVSRVLQSEQCGSNSVDVSVDTIIDTSNLPGRRSIVSTIPSKEELP